MSLDKIINDLKEMGEDEAAAKLIFARLNLIEGYRDCSGVLSETASSIRGAFLWDGTPEGCHYWSDLHDRLEQYRETRS